jgi:hypothetical protein
MQRVRIGLTGLACVFVLVLLAAAFFGLARPQGDEIGDHGTAAAADNGAAPKEPLAELGVTPGGGSDRSARPQPDPSANRPR